MSKSTPSTIPFKIASIPMVKLKVSNAIRLPALAKAIKTKTLRSSVNAIQELDDISIFATGPRTFYKILRNEIFGEDETSPLKGLLDKKASPKKECVSAGIGCDTGVTTCYLCNSTIDCNLAYGKNMKDCEHIFPFILAIVFIGVETVRNVYNRLEEYGADKDELRKRSTQNYAWAHHQCNTKKSDKKITEVVIHRNTKRLLVMPNSKEIENIIRMVCEARYIDYTNEGDELVNSFTEKIETLCAYVNNEIKALYELFQGSNIPERFYIKMIIEYYKSIMRLHAKDEMINSLDELEYAYTIRDDDTNEEITITEEIKETAKALKKELVLEKRREEEVMFRDYQILKEELFSKLVGIAQLKIPVFDETNTLTEYLRQRIDANSETMLFEFEGVYIIKDSYKIKLINNQVLVDVMKIISNMLTDGVVLDEQLLAHLISFYQFYFSYKNKKATIGMIYGKNSNDGRRTTRGVDENMFKEISCQNLFTLLEKLGWVASLNYKNSVVFEKLKNYINIQDREIDDFLPCKKVFKNLVNERIKSMKNESPPELHKNEKTIDPSLPYKERGYTEEEPDDTYEEEEMDWRPTGEYPWKRKTSEYKMDIGGKKTRRRRNKRRSTRRSRNKRLSIRRKKLFTHFNL